ncbi:multifunctional procollagen lysine hydroxylase and glycosyltransferase LH3 isoform X2 [Bicyclus anynana]|uniref:Multifunctional procollagen lysine hydroxylase and glycosyltransferase LH3 isoform X2 n=1 Tax=Bicyclus anynana TaxID=110368 RepID=A0A6J1NYR0_BICAN|nr:multifunctional procollagen lysine hydroxylase and glycosyltransferase LH3 isoform X2 [Bicyclus anynana]
MSAFLYFIGLFLLFAINTEANSSNPAVKIFTVATEETHGLQRFLRSAKLHGIDVEVLGMGQKWSGGDMNHPGGGQKVRLLKQKLFSLQKLPDRDQIIIFTDSYDVMYLAGLNVIVDKFKSMDARVLFAAEPFCWPDASLAKKYPNTTVMNPYLNSGGIIGYLTELKKVLNYKEIRNRDDDQLFYTEAFLNEDLRLTYRLALDHKSQIFQNLNGALSDVQLITNSTTESPYLLNVVTNERPLIVHGNGPSKITLNHFSNYLNNAWSVKDGCVLCQEKKIELNDDELPTVMLAVFIEQTTPFMEEFLQQLLDIDYPKKKLHLYLHNNVEYHETQVAKFFSAYSRDYLSAKSIKPTDFISEGEARNIAKGRCTNSECDYLFSVDSLSRLQPTTLRYLLSTGYDVVAPLLVRTGQSWSNFWGAINSAGYYARSADYIDIVYRNIVGIWNVPFITNCYLMKMALFRKESAKAVSYIKDDLDADMAFCAYLRDQGIMMHVSNEQELGHLVNPESFDISRKHPDIYQVIDNKLDWERRYIHDQYYDNFAEGRNHSMLGRFKIMVNRVFQFDWAEVKKLCDISKMSVFLYYVSPTMRYNYKAWFQIVSLVKSFRDTQRAMAKAMVGEYLRKQMKKEDVRKRRLGLIDIPLKEVSLNWKWAERLVRKTDRRWAVDVRLRMKKPKNGASSQNRQSTSRKLEEGGQKRPKLLE